MNRLCVFIGMMVFGWIGWWIGAKLGGFMTAFWLSSLGSIVGVWQAVDIVVLDMFSAAR